MKISHNNNTQLGFSTLEMLIAMTLLILTLTAVTMTAFGSQSMIIDSQISTEALNAAQENLENAQTLARKDFNLVNPTTTDKTLGAITYHEVVSVDTSADYMTKNITSTVTWTGEHNRAEHVSLSALVTNFEHAIGGDTCNSVLSGDWTNPQIKNPTLDFGTLVGDAAGVYPITDVDAYHGKLYVTANNTSVNNKETFFVFDISLTPFAPTFVGKLDNAAGISAGLNALHVAGSYAYVANGYGANFTTCSAGSNCAQLQVIDVTAASPAVVKSIKMPGVTGTAGQAVGASVSYKDGYVFLGLSKTAGGPEFNVIDVHDPLNPFWVGGYSVGNNINSIKVFGNYAYLATANAQELTVLDVSNPTSPTAVGGYNSLTGAGGGKSAYLVGDRLYLGKTIPNAGNDFHIIDDSKPNSTLSELGGSDIGESVNAVVVRDYLAFLLTNTELKIFSILNPTSPALSTALFLPASGSSIEPSMDCQGNILYATSNDSTNRGSLSVISTP